MTIKTIMAEELLDELSEHDLAGHALTLINVLDHDSFDDCHIKGSINIPLQYLGREVASWDRNRNIVVYCSNHDCSMSQEAYEALTRLGFTNVRAYEGGIAEWHALHHPSEGACSIDSIKGSAQPHICEVCEERNCVCSK